MANVIGCTRILTLKSHQTPFSKDRVSMAFYTTQEPHAQVGSIPVFSQPFAQSLRQHPSNSMHHFLYHRLQETRSLLKIAMNPLAYWKV